MKSKRRRLEDKLDKVFSIYIRLRDRISEDHAKCITCGSIQLFYGAKKIDCGHFMVRQHRATRWNEKNCSAQCISCNKYHGGRQYEFSMAIDKKYGKGFSDKLLIESKRVVKWSEWELQALVSDYQQRIKKELERLPTNLEIKY